MTNKIIKSSPSYNLIIGKSEETNKLCYQVVNKEYGIVEVEANMLPAAITYLNDLQAGLDSVNDPEFFEVRNAKSASNITSIKGNK